ncbi:MAG TPA: hypothetical protein DCQ73_04295 [Spirochaetaceae bacterium]|nr:hypothetical protein [Spirochaetaceae bacterium]
MGLIDYLTGWATKRRGGVAVASVELPPALPCRYLEEPAPLSYQAASFLLPLAYSVGGLPCRARLSRLVVGSPAELLAGVEPGPVAAGELAVEGVWFRWQAVTPAGPLGAWWHFPASGASFGGGGPADTAWPAQVQAIASAAAAQLKASLAAVPALAPSAFRAAACAAPAGGTGAVTGDWLRADFVYAIRGQFRPASVFCASTYLFSLARALGCPNPIRPDDPLSALAAASAAWLGASCRPTWLSRRLPFISAAGARIYLPVYELFNLLSLADLRLVIQNALVPQLRGPDLGALFLYRQRPGTPSGQPTANAAATRAARPAGTAGTAERMMYPLSFDHRRNDSLFPPTVFQDGRLDPATAAPDATDFLQRNDQAYRLLFLALYSGRLALSPAGAALIRDIHAAVIQEPAQQRLEVALTSGQPLAALVKLPERVARRAVELSDARLLASLAHGSPPVLAFVSRWCSRRKQAAMADAGRLLERALADGTADSDQLLADRVAILDQARAVMATERRDQEQELARRRRR